MDHFCYLCFVFVMFSCLLIAALWSPAGNGLTSWLSFVMFIVFLSLCGILGQVWYLIVPIPDLCHLSYFGVRFEILFDFLKKILYYIYDMYHHLQRNQRNNSEKEADR